MDGLLHGIILPLGTVLASLVAGIVIYRLLFHLLVRLAERIEHDLNQFFLKPLRRPARVLLPLVALLLVLPNLGIPVRATDILQHFTSLCLIAAIAWLFITLTLSGRDYFVSRYEAEARNNLKARAIYTQLTVLVNITLVIVVIIAVATMLMTFEKIRQVGVSILASAGIIGITVGFAAQRSISTLLAGLQIALTQPIRINDAVIVEGEWGVIEEITLTYVVIRLWDLRRLIVPVTYFLEKSFQNWTRVPSNMLGTVFFYVDYSVPVDDLRLKLTELVSASNNWDGETCILQVTSVTDRSLELRALISATDSSRLFTLRCEVREKLVTFLRQRYPGSLPRVRGELTLEPSDYRATD